MTMTMDNELFERLVIAVEKISIANQETNEKLEYISLELKSIGRSCGRMDC